MAQLARDRGRPIYAVYWVALSIVVVGVDYLSGPVIQFPALFIIPVSLAAWYSSRVWGLVLAVTLPLLRLYFTSILDAPWSFTEAAINAAIRMTVLGAFAVLVDRIAVQAKALSERVEILEGMLPICALCKRIRDDGEKWQPVEQYFLTQSKDHISHEVCPDCARRVGETFDRR